MLYIMCTRRGIISFAARRRLFYVSAHTMTGANEIIKFPCWKNKHTLVKPTCVQISETKTFRMSTTIDDLYIIFDYLQKLRSSNLYSTIQLP